MARRLLERSHDDGEDRIWDGAVGGRGHYGKLWDIALGKSDYVHRIAYRAFIGPIPEGLTVDHAYRLGCRSTLCVNPRHLEAVPNAVNQRRRRDVPRDTCVNGHPWTPENVYTDVGGARYCRICHKLSERRRRAG